MALEQPNSESSIQAAVDALSVSLGRSVLLDDPALVPLAFSRQWEVDEVRSASILSRGASLAVREALLAQGIADAGDAIRTSADPSLGMERRVCVPVRGDGEVLGYVWVLDPDGDLDEDGINRMRRLARDLAPRLVDSKVGLIRDEAEMLADLRSSRQVDRDRAAESVRSRHLLSDHPVVLCLVAMAQAGSDPLASVRRAARRLSVGHAVAVSAPEGAALIASLGDPVLRTIPEAEIVNWLLTVGGAGLAIGQSAPASLTTLDEASRQAELALRIARSHSLPAVAWADLGADRLLVQVPASARRDIPAALQRLLHDEPTLSATLGAFLDSAGDVKATARSLSLHRSGLYYRLRRIEKITGLNLDDGDDRLLAHIAIRTQQLS